MRPHHNLNRTVRRIGKVAAMGTTGLAAGVTLGVSAAGLLAWKLLRSTSRPDDWNGKVVVITGGSRGLGLALAQEAARHGARLAICARDQRELETARKQIGMEAEVGTYVCDVTNYDEVVSWIDSVHPDFGHIDVLINNAGQISVGPLESQTLTDFQEAMDVMYWGMVYPTLAVLPHMKARARVDRQHCICRWQSLDTASSPLLFGKVCCRGFFRRIARRARQVWNPCNHRLPRTHAHRLAPERFLQRRSSSRVHLVQPGGNFAGHLDECRGGSTQNRAGHSSPSYRSHPRATGQGARLDTWCCSRFHQR